MLGSQTKKQQQSTDSQTFFVNFFRPSITTIRLIRKLFVHIFFLVLFLFCFNLEMHKIYWIEFSISFHLYTMYDRSLKKKKKNETFFFFWRNEYVWWANALYELKSMTYNTIIGYFILHAFLFIHLLPLYSDKSNVKQELLTLYVCEYVRIYNSAQTNTYEQPNIWIKYFIFFFRFFVFFFLLFALFSFRKH